MKLQKTTFKSIFVIVGLCLGLVAVIYAMQYTRGGQFRRGLEIFFGNVEPSREWNWCPKDVDQIIFAKNVTEAPQIKPQDVCLVTIESVPEEKAQRPLKEYFTAVSPQGSKILEADQALEVFRVEGLIFQSQSLSHKLKRP